MFFFNMLMYLGCAPEGAPTNNVGSIGIILKNGDEIIFFNMLMYLGSVGAPLGAQLLKPNGIPVRIVSNRFN